ncbi:class I adenylate-forming enzyme family protein [Cohnella mopanensis]|uniref:class I adenylate-forming enzyme family protein n=1 Tax=Cohnella mopanensis TaxID=2911966 RepID=UPI001EF90555|nr:AMP-binding protein [Cohnella mopanensis]
MMVNSHLERNLIQRVCVGDMLTRTTQRFPNKIALVDRDVVLTYEEFNGRVNQVARTLLQRGYQKGDVVATLCENTNEFVITYFACAKSGLVVMPLNIKLELDNLVYQLNQSETKVLVFTQSSKDKVEILIDEIPSLQDLFMTEVDEEFMLGGKNIFPFSQLESGDASEIEVMIEDRDTLQLMYTSGTTSKPKGVETSHLAIYFSTMSTALQYKLDHNDSSIVMLPLFHVGGLTCILLPNILVGGTNVLIRQYNASKILNAMEQYRTTWTMLSAPMWLEISDQPGLSARDFSSMRLCVCAIATLPPARHQQVKSIFNNATIILISGQTEFTPPNTAQRPEHAISKSTAWGEPVVAQTAKAMDDDGNILPPGELGELVYRGPQSMTCYFKDPEATESAFKYGWFHSGDSGFIDEENVVWFVDRKKDIIKTGGENVASVEVELVVRSHAKVAECAAVGLPHERWSEAVTVFAKIKEGESVPENELIDFCKERLAGFKVPKKVVFINEFPMTASGKIQKHELRNIYKDLYNIKEVNI